VPENKARLLLVGLCAEDHNAGKEVSVVTDWEVERVEQRAEVILDGWTECICTSFCGHG